MEYVPPLTAIILAFAIGFNSATCAALRARIDGLQHQISELHKTK